MCVCVGPTLCELLLLLLLLLFLPRVSAPFFKGARLECAQKPPTWTPCQGDDNPSTGAWRLEQGGRGARSLSVIDAQCQRGIAALIGRRRDCIS